MSPGLATSKPAASPPSQESPTRELGEQSFPDAPEPSGQPPASGSPTSPTSPASPTDRLSASDDSSDGNASEESKGAVGAAGWRWGRVGDPPCTVGSAPAPSLCVTGGGFEWDDDFPLMPVKPSLMSSLSGTPAEPDPSVPALLPAPKQVLPLQFSRFTVSPAPVSRFSITHVSDSDMDSIGGEAPPRAHPGGPQASGTPFYPAGPPLAARTLGALCPLGDQSPLGHLVPTSTVPSALLMPNLCSFPGSSEDGDRE